MNTATTQGLRYDRELSWLSFNHRVLQEAKDPVNPLFERLKFLAIYSANLDEFFRVRVASIKYVCRLNEEECQDLDLDQYQNLLNEITGIVDQQQREFGQIFRDQIIPELARNKINLLGENELSAEQYEYLEAFFENKLKPNITPVWLGGTHASFLKNRSLYFALRLNEKEEKHKDYYAIVNVPDQAGKKRFVELPQQNSTRFVMFVDDVVRLFKDRLIPDYEVNGCYGIKISRDADLHLDEEISGNVIENIKKSLEKREKGLPSRFLYDQEMPENMLEQLVSALGLERDEPIPGGRYHNFHDFFHFPYPDIPALSYDPMSSLSHPVLGNSNSAFEAIKQQDIALFFPYQGFDHVLNWLEEAVYDTQVRSIKITLYRVARDSKVADALIRAARNGKTVQVFVEVKAKMDELNNIEWLEEMQQCGVEILMPHEYWKVHSKLFVVERIENGQSLYYAYLGTGNFNEKTTRFYCDIALLTANQAITREANQIFDFLRDIDNNNLSPQELIVAPENMRTRFEELVDREIDHAKADRPASLFLKMNSLQDKKMIKKLYEASNAGVQIRLIIRGICCLIPGILGQSDHIQVISLLDRFLEHSRVYIFGNGGKEEVYLASADWMKRNLSRRVEVAFPVHDPEVRKDVKKMMDLQWRDNTKARLIDQEQVNHYQTENREQHVRAQYDLYDYLAIKEKKTEKGSV